MYTKSNKQKGMAAISPLLYIVIASVSVLSVTSFIRSGSVDLGSVNTDSIAEGLINLYFTEARARQSISVQGTGISYNAETGVITSSITGGADIESTDDVPEGDTNKYFTEERARAALSAGTGVSYNSETGVISSTVTNQWQDSESDIFYNAGNVGIGTSGPVSKLHVVGDVNVSSGEIIQSGVSIGFGNSTVIDNTTGTIDTDKIYNFITYREDSPGAKWATRIDGTGNEESKAIATDATGNVYVIGDYSSDPVSIYNKDGTVFGTLDSDGGNNVIFVVKYNTSGMAQWATRIVRTGYNSSQGITTDTSGNVYVTGYYESDPVNIYNSDGTSFTTLTSDGGQAAFIVKYNTSGMAQWAARIDGSSIEAGNDIQTDADGNVYVTGYYFSTTIVYNANGTVFGSLANSNFVAAFVVKYNTSGTAQWATRIEGPESQEGVGIATDTSGNVYVTGYYVNLSVTFFNSDGTTFGTLANSGGNAAFVVKYDALGFVQWITRVDGTNNEAGNGIATDTDGNVYVTGLYLSSPVTIFNADTTTFGTLPLTGSGSAFIVKYNTSGAAQWATRISGAGAELGYGIATDATGNVYVTGIYNSNPVTIFNEDGTTFGTLTNSGGFAAYVVKYNTSGTAQWATRIDGVGDDQGYGIDTDANGNVYVSGYYFTSPVTVYDINGTEFETLENAGNGAVFVVKYSDPEVLPEIPYELPLLPNLPINQGRIVTLIKKSATAPTVKVLNSPIEEVSVEGSRKFLYFDNKWYQV
jgi:sugar lactone lactonase YvrE